MGDSREQRLVATFVALADTGDTEDTGGTGDTDHGVVDLLQTLVDNVVSILDAAGASVVLVDEHEHLELLVSTDERSAFVGRTQCEVGAGPAVEAFTTGEAVCAADADTIRRRWPGSAGAFEQVGYGSVHAVPLRLRATTLGAMDMFRESGGAMPDEDAVAARGLADVATIRVLERRSVERSLETQSRLQHALDSRVVIEQAKGIIAHAHGVDMTAAFAMLRRYARSGRLRIADAARAVVDGEVPVLRLSGTSAAPTRAPTPRD